MNLKYYFSLFILLFSIILYSNVESKTDCVIITSLDHSKFISPALRQNNSFVYNNFEFRLYSNIENTTYEIEIDNIMIANGTIKDFIKIIYWKFNNDYVNKIIIRIGNDYYNYSNISIFYSSFTNGTVEEEDKIIFTKDEFKIYINDLKLRLFSSDGLGWFIGIVLAMIYVREYKKSVITEV